MKKLHTLLLLPLGLSFVSCANQTWRVDAGPMFVRTRGKVSLQNAGGTLDLGSNENTVEGDLGLDHREASPYVRAQMDQGKHRVRIGGYHLDTQGSGVLAGDYGGLVAGSQVTTSERLFVIDANYGYELLRNEHYRLAAGGQLGFYSLDINARSTAGYEQVNTDLLVPMPFFEAECFLGPVTVGANAGLMSAKLRDASGRYWDVEAYAKVQASDQFELIAGYRYLLLNAHGTATGRDFRADMDVQGLFLGAGVKF